MIIENDHAQGILFMVMVNGKGGFEAAVDLVFVGDNLFLGVVVQGR